MEIIITNTKVKVQSLPLVTKGNQSLNSVSGARVTGSAKFNSIWCLDSCTNLRKIIGINYVPCFYSEETQQTTRFYKINKVTHERSLIAEHTATDAELNIPKHLDVDVELSENEYIGISGAMYYTTSGSNTFSYTVYNDTITDNQTINLWYNIEGFA